MSLVKIIVFHLAMFGCVYLDSTSTSGSPVSREVGVCTEEHKFRCQERELISIASLVCGNGSACPLTVNRTMFDLCQGQQTCSSLGLAEMLSSHCGHNVTRKEYIQVKFTCLKGTTSLCRSNICAESSSGLVCPSGTQVHIRGMTCGSVTEKCPISSYTNVYVCEGADSCSPSGLSTLLPQSCQQEVAGRRNVVVRYMCVSDRQTESTCTPGKNRTLDKEFGIVRSWVGPTVKGHTKTPCTWKITPSADKIVKVIVHIVNAKVTQDGCDPRVLSITFVDCRNRSEVTRGFCNLSSSGSEVISCGHVLIESTVPHGEEPADMFVVSYQTYSPNDYSLAPHGLQTCLAPPEIRFVQTTPTHTIQTSRTSARPSPKSISAGRNYGPGDGLFEYRDSAYQEDAAGTGSSDDSSGLSKHLKLMILYIFFGVVILVLAVALIAVIVSYHKISKFKEDRVDSNEKTALWTHNEETPLETFLNNNLIESSATLSSETVCGHRPGHGTDQVVATIHREAVGEQGGSPARLSAGSGVSTFLAGRKDSLGRDFTKSARSSSVASNVSYIGVADEDPASGYSVIGRPGYFNPVNTGPLATSSHCDGNIYEAVDVNYRRPNVQNNDINQCVFNTPDITSTDTNYEDKLYELVNNDPDGVALQNQPSSGLHYSINNDEYAVVSTAGKRAKSPKTSSHEETPWANNYQDCEETVDFRPTSGPYDRRRTSADDSSSRWSNGEGRRWTDEV